MKARESARSGSKKKDRLKRVKEVCHASNRHESKPAPRTFTRGKAHWHIAQG
jgi:hypothetical protein